MSVYPLVHLAIAGLCVLFAGVHVFHWRLQPADRAQPALALAFCGVGLLSFGMAGSSTGSHDLGNHVPWLRVANASAPITWPMLGLLPPLLAGRRPSRARVVLGVTLGALGLVRWVDVAVQAALGRVQFWEDTIYTLATPSMVVHWAACFGVIGVWLVDAFRQRARNRTVLFAVGTAALGLWGTKWGRSETAATVAVTPGGVKISGQF